jgi:cytosine permease
MSMGVGLTIVLTLFVDAGTVTADFNRWAKNGSDSLIATFSAFPFANLIAMLVGGVMTAALAVPNANPFGSDNMFGYMNAKQIGWLTALAFIFVYLNLGSVCSHCLYNSATGWSRILNGHMRVLAVVLGAIGIIVAATNVWAYFIEWLTILGILVPPIGAIILVDQYVLKNSLDRFTDWHSSAFIAWIAGSAAGLAIEFYSPSLSTAITSFLVATVVYYFVAKAKGSRTA